MSRCAALAVFVLGLIVPALPAHPVPKENHDRHILVRLLHDRVVIDYRLELDEFRATRDLPDAVLRQARDRLHLHRLYLEFFAPVLANNLVVQADGQVLELRCIEMAQQTTDHVRCVYRFEAKWPAPAEGGTAKAGGPPLPSPSRPAPDGDVSWPKAPPEEAPGAGRAGRTEGIAAKPERPPLRLKVRESNFDGDNFSLLRLTVASGTGVEIVALTAPDEELMSRPAPQRRDGDDERLRTAAATFQLSPTLDERGALKPALPPDLAPPRLPPLDEDNVALIKPPPGQGETAGASRAATAEASARSKPALTPTDFLPPLIQPDGQAGAAKKKPQTMLDLLFRSQAGLALVLLLAALFGAAHALTPGHGKTLVAAYLVGERGTVGHAVVLGLVTTLTHTGSVIVLAALLHYYFPRQALAGVQGVLGLVGGLLIAGLGLWLLLRRLAGQADHVHIGGGHHHHHHGPSPERMAGWWGLVLLGVTGGLVPCVDAIVMLMAAISRQQLELALPLLLAFSAGLAGVLVLLGIVVVYARKEAAARWGASPRLSRVVRALPVISASLVLALGLWLCFDSAHVEGP
jgi:ABC-type nickel/cobalt efflux system permease component RcnA